MEKYISTNDFFNQTIGKSLDVDKVAGVQCVDLFKKFTILVWDFYVALGGTGFAKELWLRFDKLKYKDYFSKVDLNKLQDGDWLIWGDCKIAPKSHVGMFREYKSNNKALILHQPAGEKVGQIELTLDGVIGAIRPNIYKEVSSQPETVAEPTTSLKEDRKDYKKGEKKVTVKAGTIYYLDSYGSKAGKTQKKDYNTSISIEFNNGNRLYPINVYGNFGQKLGWIKKTDIR